jgi:hypothetical protein
VTPISPEALRAIADFLEVANEEAAGQLRGLLNGHLTPEPIDAVPEAPPVATPAAGTSLPDSASGAALKCPDCGKTYAYAKALRSHRAGHRSELATFQ